MSKFSKLAGALAGEAGVRNPAALAASIGRKKYGEGKMAKLSAAGRKKRAAEIAAKAKRPA